MRNPARVRPVLALALATALLSPATLTAQQAPRSPDADAMRQLYGEGIDFGTFLANASRRRQMWDANWAKSDPASDFVARAGALHGRYLILAVAVDSCSDSVNTIPYIARLVERVDGLDLRIVHPNVGALLMQTYRTPDDRGATPTVAIVDEDFEVVGSWVERPSPLQNWWLGHPEITVAEKARRKQGWYDWDEGYSTYAEIIGLLEAADARR